MESLFLSYRRADSQEVVGRIYDRLKSHFPVERIFRDLDSIPLGKQFPEVIREAVGKSKVALVVIGPRWTAIANSEGKCRLEDPTDFVRIEVELALGSGILVVPVLVSGASMPTAEELPPSLQPFIFLQAIQIRPDPDFHRDMDRLIGKLSDIITETLAVDNDDRTYSRDDEEIVKALYVCFDRPAFKVTFEHESDLEALIAAVDDTIAAINTGVTKRRDGVVFGQPVKGKSYLKSDNLASKFDRIVELLSEVKRVFAEAQRKGYFYPLAPGHLAFHHEHQPKAVGMAVRIDDLRNQALVTANEIYSKLGLRPFRLIETPESYLGIVKEGSYEAWVRKKAEASKQEARPDLD